MTEDDAREWCRQQFGGDVTRRLADYVALLKDEGERQNLISPSTKPAIWSRHIVDSAQLLALAPSQQGHWVDIGSGAGLPGLVIAMASGWRVVLIEPRKLRAEFLVRAVDALGMTTQVCVLQANANRAGAPLAAVVSARAVATAGKLLNEARGFSDLSTTFLLPKGATAQAELENVQQTWHGMFHVEQSITDPDAGIIVATQVRPR